MHLIKEKLTDDKIKSILKICDMVFKGRHGWKSFLLKNDYNFYIYYCVKCNIDILQFNNDKYTILYDLIKIGTSITEIDFYYLNNISCDEYTIKQILE
jgi:hypothetical protein